MSQKKTTEQFIEDAKKVHGDLDSFDKVEYNGNKVKVCITCKEHGDYWMKPNSYLSGQRCPVCGRKKSNENKVISLDEFKRRAIAVHGDKYDYSKVQYVSALSKVEVLCPEHGSFFITPAHLWEGHGCNECAKIARSEKRSKTYEGFVKDANLIHDNKYAYNNGYIKNHTKTKITYPKHCNFEQKANGHLNGKGSPHCGHSISNAEEEIYKHLLQFVPNEDIIRHDKTVLGEFEIDIYLPKNNLGIEYNGLRLHSEEFCKGRNYHLSKTEAAEAKGIHLIQIFEDEWIKTKDLVLEKIVHFIGCSNNKVIGARKCNVVKIGKDVASEFLNKYHFQGFVPSTVYLGAYYNDELVGVMTFLNECSNKWNLTRFTTNYAYSLPGLANKIFKYFIEGFKPSEVKTFLDRRWSHCNCNVYERMGFRLAEVKRPDYRYVDGYERRHKFCFRKNTLNRKYGLPLTMTEYEMTQELGFYRIWDCGLFKYVWKPE